MAAVLTSFWGNIIFKLVLVIVSVIWSSLGEYFSIYFFKRTTLTTMEIATVAFLSQLVPKDRKALAVYPVVLFYIVLGWMVLMHKPFIDVVSLIEQMRH